MQNINELLGYLIPISLIAGFILFPALIWLSKADETKKKNS